MDALWTRIETGSLEPEGPLLARLIADAALSDGDRARIVARGADLVGRIRADVRPSHRSSAITLSAPNTGFPPKRASR